MADFLERLVSQARGSGVTAVPPSRVARAPLSSWDVDETASLVQTSTALGNEPATPRVQHVPSDTGTIQTKVPTKVPIYRPNAEPVDTQAKARAWREEAAPPTQIVVRETPVELPVRSDPSAAAGETGTPRPTSPAAVPVEAPPVRTAVSRAPGMPAVAERAAVNGDPVVTEARPNGEPQRPWPTEAETPILSPIDLSHPAMPAVSARPRSAVTTPWADAPAPAMGSPGAIHVHIGRVDIRGATPERVVEPRVEAPAQAPRTDRAVLSLSEYLHGRSGEARP